MSALRRSHGLLNRVKRLIVRAGQAIEKPAAVVMGLVHVALWCVGLWWLLGVLLERLGGRHGGR